MANDQQHPSRHAEMKAEHADDIEGGTLQARWAAELAFELEYGENGEPKDPAAAPTEAKKPLVASIPALYGLFALDDPGPGYLLGHDLCDLLTFCRNPLHPGPCKGWKHSLKAVAPGLHQQVERRRLERVNADRARRTAEAVAAGKAAPRFRKLRHERGDQAAPKPPTPDEPVVSDERRARIAAADERYRKAGNVDSTRTSDDGQGGNVDRKGQGKGRDGDGDGLRGEGDKRPTGRVTASKVVPGMTVISDGSSNHSTPAGTETRIARVGWVLPRGGVVGYDAAGNEVLRASSNAKIDIRGEADPDAPMVLKGPAQREALGRVVNAGDAGYDNKLGRLNAKDRKLLTDNKLAEQGPDGRWRATDKGRATHEASIPRRNGEYISGIDGLTDSERQAKEEQARGEEAKRLEAQRVEQFRRGIPGPTDQTALARYTGPSGMRVSDASRKVAASLQKDLGEGTEDWGGTVSPAARDWHDKMRTVDQRGAEWHALGERANFLLAAEKADPDHAGEYRALYEANKTERDAASKAWDASIKDANAARDTLAQAVIDRYQAKGKRKTAAALKLPEARRDQVFPAGSQPDSRVRDANTKADAAIKGLDHNLEDWQTKRAVDARNDYTRSVVELEKATIDRQAAQDEDRRARGVVSDLLRTPSNIRGGGWSDDKAAADAAAKSAARRYETADERYRSAQDWNRRADSVLTDTVANLRAEQVRNGGPKPETELEKMQRESGDAAKRAADERLMLETELGVMPKAKLRAEAKRLGYEPARGESEESIAKKLVPLRERESVRLDPPGNAPDLDPDVRAQLAADALAEVDRYNEKTMASVERRRAAAQAAVERGGIPYARAVAAQTVGKRRGWDIRTSEGHEKYRSLMGLPAKPKGTGPGGLTTQADMDREGWKKIQIPLSEIKFGDTLGGLDVTSWDEPDTAGRMRVQGLGVLGMDVERAHPATDQVTVWRKVGQ
jgi:hypothetical protein